MGNKPKQRPIIPVQRPAIEKSEKGPKQGRAKAPRRVRPDNLTAREQTRVDRAAAFCIDTLTEGWKDAVAAQAADCITPKTWRRLFGRRRRADCKVLADLAKSLLDGKESLHDLVGSVASRITGWVGGQAVERAVVRELAQRIPYLWLMNRLW